MKNIWLLISLTSFLFIQFSCSSSDKDYDASGSFEAIERTISAEASGKIISLNIEEGMILNVGDTIGRIDATSLMLQGDQVRSSINAISQKTNDPSAQIMILESQLQSHDMQTTVLEQELTNLSEEIDRFSKLVDGSAAPQKQLDDLEGRKLVLAKQIDASKARRNVIVAQITAARENVGIQNRAILSEIEPNEKRLLMIEKQISDASIVNEFKGTVTAQIAYDGEFTNVGKPLYRIADLTTMTLKAYITGKQLPNIRLNEEVIVRTDDGSGGYEEKKGRITWISSKAEFTPKTIQTKDERANLVYAIKVKVSNDGRYKIGMYGEVVFDKEEMNTPEG